MTVLEQITAIIRRRRSIKPVDMDADQTVPKELLETLLTNATWAPNHGLTEPWRFDVFTGTQRHVLAEALQTIYREVTPPSEFRDDKLQKMGANPKLAPVIIAASMIRKGAPKIPADEEVQAVACGLQNLMLTATAAGLASFWSSPPLLGSAQFKQWLGIREEDGCIGLIYIGWPRKGSPEARSTRHSLDSCVHWRS